MTAHLNVKQIDSNHYSLAFETDHGKVVCEVSLGDAGRRDGLSKEEKRQTALHRAKLLASAFHQAIAER
jgi:hypothetical protein